MNVSELIERLRKWHKDTGAPSYRDAADALESQAREIAELKAWHAEGYAGQLESRLAAAERERDLWRREAELNQQVADKSATHASWLAEAMMLLREARNDALDARAQPNLCRRTDAFLAKVKP